MYRKYYSYSDMPRMISKEESEPNLHMDTHMQKTEETPSPGTPDKIFGKFENDDIILGIIILVLLMDDGDDSLLLIALAVIFLTGVV